MSYLSRTLEQTEELAPVDAPAELVQGWLGRLLPDQRRITSVLSGSWLGHPLHPALVLLPIGAWTSAIVVDLFPGQQTAARRLVLAGLITAVPTSLAGATDYRKLDRRQRRVAFLHLLSNATASACFATSYGKRRRGRTAAGRLWGLAGLLAVNLGGALGGHLTYAQGVGVHRFQPESPTEPTGGEPTAVREYAEPTTAEPTGGGRGR